MKHLIRYTAFLFCCWLLLHACQPESMEIPEPAITPPAEGKATIALVPTLGAEILQGSETEPMTRTQNLVRTRLINRYHVVIIKKSDTKWIIDTLIMGKIDPSINDKFQPVRINVYDTSSLPVIRLDLRPGTYKAGFFLNANDQNWNPLLKPGYVVAEKEDITPKDELPVAYTYRIQTSGLFQDSGRIMLKDEPFAGWTSFTIGKNDTLRQTGPLREQNLTLNRRATRIRYVMKDTVMNAPLMGYPFRLEITNTPFFFNAYLKVPKSTPFCQGLNILGGGYYPRDSICTSLKIYISTVGEAFTSPVNGLKYLMPTPENSTYCTNCILMDEYYPDGFECEITDISVSSQPEKPIFTYDGSIKRTFKLNGVTGFILQPSSTREGIEYSEGKYQFYLEENPEANAVDIFDLFFELNPKALSQ